MNRRKSDSRDATLHLPAALDAIEPAHRIELDVRDDLRNGREPFGRIMAARAQLPPGGALAVRATFEPMPLYKVMGKQGFAHFTERIGEDDWRVWFYPAPVESAPAPPPAPPATEPEEGGGYGLVILDVRGLEPPEPMVRTLAALTELPPDGTLVQLNTRVPQFLLPLLEERGFTYEVRTRYEGLVRVFIRRATQGGSHDSPPSRGTTMETTRTLDVRVLSPREKHPTIFTTFAALAPGESFVLVNDHDPKPLRYQFDYEHAGKFGWEYLEQGPMVWRVQISRTGA